MSESIRREVVPTKAGRTVSSPLALSDAKRQLLERRLRGDGAVPSSRPQQVLPRPAGVDPPLTAEQNHLWLQEDLMPGSNLYNEAITIHYRGAFDRATMERSLNELLRRHEIWRTAMRPGPDEAIVQVALNDIRLSLPLVDLTGLPASEREAEAYRRAAEAARIPFDLSSPPLLRVTAYLVGADRHLLCVTLHHIIFDGVSLYRVIMPELAAIYAAFLRRSPLPLTEPRLQYADYAAFQASGAVEPLVARQLDLWRSALVGAPATSSVPTDHPRPSRPGFAGATEHFALPNELVTRLTATGRSVGATPYTVLLAGFKALLHRFSGQEDLVIGGALDTRRRPELEQLVGCFLNVVPLRTAPQGSLPFRQYVLEVHDKVVAALDICDAPFARVVQAAQPRREAGAHPLFQAVFSIEPPSSGFADGWDLTQMDVEVTAAKFDLYLELEERPDAYACRLVYRRDLYDAETIRRLIGCWLRLLHGAADDPDCPLGLLPLMDPETEGAVLRSGTGAVAAVGSEPVHELIRAQAERAPGAPAVVCGDESLTYGALEAEAVRIAARLTAAGAGPGHLVALSVERSASMVAALLGILKTGAAFLPLDPTLPAARMAFIIRNASASLLLTQRPIRPRLPDVTIPVLLLDEPDAAVPSGAAPTCADLSNLAYVLYTSGSTGQPKGVEVPHRALVNLLASMQREIAFSPADCLLAVTTLSFDIALLELFLPLMMGGRVVVASRSEASDPAVLSKLIGSSGCTVMQATPATWRGLIESGWEGCERLTILCGGEAMPKDLGKALLLRGRGVLNLYGPTETTIWSSSYRVLPGERGPAPIGQPVQNTCVHVLNAAGALMPPMVVGEIHIGGVGLARGYRGRPDLTDERFGEFGAKILGRLYRTGDLGRRRADGTLEWLGRGDSQIKLRGFRIGPEEVEAALESHPEVTTAAVTVRLDASGEPILVAFVVVANGAAALPLLRLRPFLAALLPQYMIPSQMLEIPALPLTPNGKKDRQALPASHATASETGGGVLTATEMEQRLAAVWAEVLGKPIRLQDDFFDLGGHSLLLARLLARVNQEFGQKLPMANVFEAPTVARMAALLACLDRGGDLPMITAIQPLGTRPDLIWLGAGPAMRRVSKALGPEQPFHTVNTDKAIELAGGEPSLQEIAVPLRQAIQAERQGRPFVLAGFCNEGILAYEVAAQLAAEGVGPKLLILLEAQNPAKWRPLGTPMVIAAKLRHHAIQTWRMKGRRLHYLQLRLRALTQNISMPAWGGYTLDKLTQAAFRYVPLDYAGEVALLQVRRPARLDFRPAWASVVRGHLSSSTLSIPHESLLEPEGVGPLAAAINEKLHEHSRATPPWDYGFCCKR